MIYLGTSGFSYEDWVGPFYPAGLPRREWLAYYARQFDACEINSTYYALPPASTMQSLVRRTGEGFLFAVKAHQEMTHRTDGGAEVCAAFRRMLEPLTKSGRLGCVLAQFPYSFDRTAANQGYIERLREQLGDLPLVIEFRNARWLQGDTFDWMRRLGVGFCCVDEPALPNLMPALAEVTGPIAYVRFHGRNAAKWWQHEHAYERYDYTYTEAELEEWVPRILDLGRSVTTTFVFANNHWRGQSIDTVRKLRTLLQRAAGDGKGAATARLAKDLSQPAREAWQGSFYGAGTSPQIRG